MKGREGKGREGGGRKDTDFDTEKSDRRRQLINDPAIQQKRRPEGNARRCVRDEDAKAILSLQSEAVVLGMTDPRVKSTDGERKGKDHQLNWLLAKVHSLP